MERRKFIQLISLAGAGVVSGCKWSSARKELYPFVVPPDNVVPGIANWYASFCNECPASCGTLIRTREGRPVKIEGNPEHPINNGRLCARGQSALQGLYNPDRILSPLMKKNGKFEKISWAEAEETIISKIKIISNDKNKTGIITPLLTGTTNKLLNDFTSDLNIKNVINFETINYEYIKNAFDITFSKPVIPQFDFKEAEVVVSFNCDFLETWISPVKFAGDFANKRNPEDGMSKFIFIGPRLSLTASNADIWLKTRSGDESLLALGVLNQIIHSGNVKNSNGLDKIRNFISKFTPDYVSSKTGADQEKILSIAKSLLKAKKSIVFSGEDNSSNPEKLQVIVNLINYVLGNINETISFGNDYSIWNISSQKQADNFVTKLNTKEISTLMIYNSNPVYAFPKNWEFEKAIQSGTYIINFATYYDETVDKSDLVIPIRTVQERWGDFESTKGIYNLHQPLLEPIHEAYSFEDILIEVIKEIDPKYKTKYPQSYFDYLKNSWKNFYVVIKPSTDFETFFRHSIQKGVVWIPYPNDEVKLNEKVFSLVLEEERPKGITLISYPSIKYYDGRGANKPWLQEMPDPVTSIVWDSWAELHPETAKKFQIENDDRIIIEASAGKIETPVFIYEGIAPDTIAIPMGQGHNNFGRYAFEHGVNPLEVVEAKNTISFYQNDIKLSKSTKSNDVVSVSGSFTDLDRGIIKTIPISDIGKEHEEEKEPQIYPPVKHDTYRWGMIIDLNKCIGCGACGVACYAENNIPAVGKIQVGKGREMAWLQVHRYFKQTENETGVNYIPMLCQQCTAAPCESVCPVYATHHNSEGLNVQVYNRCIGTRYCSNNCPYKVRRFNWFTYEVDEPLNWQLNPDVTVREKGVMEKCTFCIQRIRDAKIKAKNENRLVKDGEIVPACMQTCPTGVFEFGNLLDENSKVSKMANDGRSYYLLGHLNTIPGVKYLKKVINI